MHSKWVHPCRVWMSIFTRPINSQKQILLLPTRQYKYFALSRNNSITIIQDIPENISWHSLASLYLIGQLLLKRVLINPWRPKGDKIKWQQGQRSQHLLYSTLSEIERMRLKLVWVRQLQLHLNQDLQRRKKHQKQPWEIMSLIVPDYLVKRFSE